MHLVDDKDDKRRAYPGEKPNVKTGDDCDDSKDVCLERPNVAFFLTHALRELQAFVDSLEERIDQLYGDKDWPPVFYDEDEQLSQALNLHPVTHADSEDEPSFDIVRLLRLIRLSFLVPVVQAFATVARIAEGPIPYQIGIPFEQGDVAEERLEARGYLVALLDRFIDSMRDRIERFVRNDATARRIWELIDLLAAHVRGILAAGLEDVDDFSSLDEWNYVDWLRMNRIAERTLRSPLLRGGHDLGLAYRDGDARQPQMAAGQAISAACRFFFMYKGALFWRLKAGMGEVLFAPMYLALRRRGVKFRFFHRLDEIVLDDDGKAVTALRFLRQVALRNQGPETETNYEPLMTAGEMPGWPRDPHVDQFDFDDETRKQYDRLKNEDDQNVNFDSIWCKWPHGEEVFATIGAGKRPKNRRWIGHYDKVIVTVPVAALGRVSKQLVAAKVKNPAGARWEDMLKNLGTVATQSVQLWVNKPTRDLGWTHGQVSLSAFVHPFDTWADLSQLIEVEQQPDAYGVHYFCSVLPEWQLPEPLRLRAGDPDPANDDVSVEAIAAAREVVRQNAEYFLNEWILHLWPEAVHRYPNTFKWELLVDPENGSEAERLKSQRLVANVDPSDRYTQSLPGTHEVSDCSRRDRF